MRKSLRDKIKTLKGKAKILENKMLEFTPIIRKKEEEIIKLKRRIILEEKLLFQDVWKLVIRENPVYFYLINDEDNFPKLMELVDNGWPHSSFPFDNKNEVALHWNDGELSIYIEKQEKFFSICKEMGIEIDASNIEEKLEKEEKRLKNLRDFLKKEEIE